MHAFLLRVVLKLLREAEARQADAAYERRQA
jgi:hypothetical protein